MDKRIKVISAIFILCLLFFIVGLRIGVSRNSGNKDVHSLVNPYLFCEIHKGLNVSENCDGGNTDNCIGNNDDLVAYSTDVLGFYLSKYDYVGGGDYFVKNDRE